MFNEKPPYKAKESGIVESETEGRGRMEQLCVYRIVTE